MEINFQNKVIKKIYEIKKKNIINNSTFDLKITLFVKEIYQNEDKQFIKNIFCNTNAKQTIKIFDIFEVKNILYIISDKENISQIEKLLLNKKSNLEKEGIIFQNSEPISKKEIDNLYNHEKSMGKIKFENLQNERFLTGKGSGFFCLISDSDIPFTKAFFTANHILNKSSLENEKTIIIEHLNKIKKFEITSKRKYFTNEKLDYSCIEILEEDEIKSDYFFKIEPNILNDKKKSLKNQEIFILQYPMGGDLSFSSGRIININNDHIFHSASTCKGSSGSPIIRRFNYNIVGLHFGSQINDENNYVYYNYATPFDSILKDIKQKIYNNNVIVAKIKINNDNSVVRIINSYENSVREGLNLENVTIEKNEEEIKKCIIFIKEEKLKKFEYNLIFQRKGEYTIKYIFPTPLNSTNYMFHKCENIINIDLSHFNSSYVTNMCGMFEKCHNLKEIKFDNLNTSNVKNMSWMFNECESLISLNLSNFQTQNVENMICMFNRCNSLKTLNLSNLDAQKVKNMICMFWGCESLTKIDFSKFKTKNIVNMEKMFHGCFLLDNLDLSDFNTEKVEIMSNMFQECKSLKKLNLSSFRTPKVKNMTEMFFRCESLESLNLSNFTLESIVNIDGMFADMKSLTSLDLSNFNTQNEASIKWLFGGTKNLKKNNVKTNNKIIKNQL